jgi:RNA polymerase sigma-70 factor (ECF subfamily)
LDVDPGPEVVPNLDLADGRDGDPAIEKKRWQLAGLDPEKFDYFYDRYFDRIFEYAFWQTGDHDQAADVANETFMLAWERRGQFRWQGYSLGAWLFQIARSLTNRDRRRVQLRQETPFVAAEHELIDETTPAVVLERRKDQALVRHCLAQLPAERYDLMVLHHFLGLTTREIAVITKTPLGTVNSHLRRSRQAVRRCLEEHGAGHGLSPAAQQAVRQDRIDESGLSVVDEKGDK